MLSYSWIVQEMEIFQWEVRQFFLKIVFLHVNNAFKTGISLFSHLMLMRQNFDPIWSEALVSNHLLCDYLGLTFQVVAYGRFNRIKVLLLHFFSHQKKKIFLSHC